MPEQPEEESPIGFKGKIDDKDEWLTLNINLLGSFLLRLSQGSKR